jgi:hypothetical protein
MFDLAALRASDMAGLYEYIMAFVNTHFVNLHDPDTYTRISVGEVDGDEDETTSAIAVEEDEEGTFWASSVSFDFSWAYYAQIQSPEGSEQFAPVTLGIGINCSEEKFEICVVVNEVEYHEIPDESAWNSVMETITELNPEFDLSYHVEQNTNDQDLYTHEEVEPTTASDFQDTITIRKEPKTTTHRVKFSEKVLVHVFSFEDDVLTLTDTTDEMKPPADPTQDVDRPVKRQKA